MNGNLKSEHQHLDKSVLEVLAFARETGKDEIEAIDRLHKRTLLSLSILTGVLAVVISVFGWIGFANLKRVAIATASDVVRQRLDDALTKEKIDAAVRFELSQHAEIQITDSIKNQINETVKREVERESPELRKQLSVATNRSIQALQPQIADYAKEQAEHLVKEMNAPRILSAQQTAKLSACARQFGKLTIPVDVGGDPEAQNLATVLAKALSDGGWETNGTALLSGHPELPRYGIVIAVAPSAANSASVKAAVTCLNTISLDPIVRQVPTDREWGPGPVDIIVQPKAR